MIESKHWVFGDIHGCKPIKDMILKFIDDHPYDQFYFLGDAADRGEDGYEVMVDLIYHPRVTYIKGNHEDMFVKAADTVYRMMQMEGIKRQAHYNDEGAETLLNAALYTSDVSLLVHNGGYSTLLSWIKEGLSSALVNRVRYLPTKHDLIINGKNIELTHAGHRIGDTDYIWSRDHFNEEWEGGLMIHGHTPVEHLVPCIQFVDDDTEICIVPLFYANNTKLCMDTGAYFYKCIYLYNMDDDTFVALNANE